MNNIELFKDYENAKLQTAKEFAALHKNQTVPFDKLASSEAQGIPICVRRDEKGKLQVTFIPDTHLLAIGATRSGKTTGYVLPTLNVLLKKKNKPSLVISDPKQELYRGTAKKFEANGYKVLMLDFTNYTHSECWNPLTKYYRLYQQYIATEAGINLIETKNGLRNEFMGVVYESQQELDNAVADVREGFYDEVEKGITALTNALIPTVDKEDPFWEDSARALLQAFLYAMLEDGASGKLTEAQYSFDTVLRIFDSFTDSGKAYDGGYFTDRPLRDSKAHQLARKCIIEQAENTRRCISSMFVSRMNKFRDTAVRRITASNTFEMRELDDGAPVVIFVSYKDEESLHYEVISMFLSNLYTELIAAARSKGGKLQRPFYFLLDEFGNLPKFNDFDKVISACAGRNLWFLLVLQSYAQLYNVYGKETAEIIKDNLNVHVFFGTNNPQTKREFSEECGQKTIIAPTSALNGSGESIVHFEKDSVALIPVSSLTQLKPGECIVTQMLDDVMWSRIERSYTCPEFASDDADPDSRKTTQRFVRSAYVYERKDSEVKKDKIETMLSYYGDKNYLQPDAYTIQERLKTVSFVTVPWLQTEYELTYLQARKLVDFLILRGWLSPQATGVRYPVLREKLLLRKLKSHESARLIADMTVDCCEVLRRLRKDAAHGVQHKVIADAVCSPFDAKEAIDLLIRHNLIFRHNGLHFCAVSDAVVEVLCEVAHAKRRCRADLPDNERTRLLRMFELVLKNQ